MSTKEKAIEIFDTSSDDNTVIVDFSFCTTDKAATVELEKNKKETTDKKISEKKPKKQKDKIISNPNRELQMSETNIPYNHTYNETNTLLKGTIVQIDMLSGEIKEEVDKIKNSKTLKKKYDYISELTSTSSSLIGTKISAIKELNNSITQCHNLELKRIKELNLGKKDDKNDDMQVMDLYNAFINAPVGNKSFQMAPSIQDFTLMGGPISRGDGAIDSGINSFISNMSPEQNAMLLETNNNIETVVMFNPETGARWFDVIDKTTNRPVPNISKPDNFLLEDTIIDPRALTARNKNLDTIHRVVLVGNEKTLAEY